MSMYAETHHSPNANALSPKRSAIIGSVFEAYSGLCVSIRRRRKLRGYLEFNDRMLNDIGVTREEVEWAVQLPLSENAALKLQQKAKARRQQNPYR